MLEIYLSPYSHYQLLTNLLISTAPSTSVASMFTSYDSVGCHCSCYFVHAGPVQGKLIKKKKSEQYIQI